MVTKSFSELRILFTALLVMPLMTSDAASSTSRVALVSEGRAQAVILMDAQPTAVAQVAARELQDHVRLITGATLPIRKITDARQAGDGVLPIYVGESAGTKALGVTLEELAQDGYLVSVSTKRVVLAGCDADKRTEVNHEKATNYPDVKDERGTLNAVYDFLEKGCGVRWYLPTALGVTFQARATLAVPAMEIRRAPAMKGRTIYYASITADMITDPVDRPSPGHMNLRDRRLWDYRQRVNGDSICNHSFYGYYDRFLKTRPELFAKGYEGKARPPHLCYSSRAVVEQVAQDARDYFDGKGLKLHAMAFDGRFGLAPMDGRSWCKCDACQAQLDNDPATNLKAKFFASGEASDYWFGFVNNVAQEVKKTHPHAKFVTLAYAAYAMPPRKARLDPSVAVQVCIADSISYDTPSLRHEMDVYRQWAAGGRTTCLWLYHNFPNLMGMLGKFRPFPGFHARSTARLMREFGRAGAQAIFIENDGAKDGGVYGRSVLQKQLEEYVTFKLADDPSLDGAKLVGEFFPAYYGAAAVPMRRLYDEIEAAYGTQKNYPPKMFGKGPAHQTQEVAWTHLGTDARMKRWSALLADAVRRAKTDAEKQRVDLWKRGVWDLMVAGKAAWTALADKVPLPAPVAVPKVAPSADLTTLDWSRAALITGLRGLNAEPSTRKLDVRVLHDGERLHLQLTDPSDPAQLVQDKDFWANDIWEIFFTRDLQCPMYHLAVGVDGKSQSLVHTDMEPTAPWASGATFHSDTRQRSRWTTSISVPLKSLLPGPSFAKQKLHLNLFRLTHATNAAAWVPTFGGIHAPARMGTLLLE
jgi:hypothetical protein